MSGKIVERNVDVGAHVQPGDLLARLEPNEEAANLKSAKAAVEAAEAQLKQVSAVFERQKSLLASGYTTRRDFDQSQEGYRTAQASLDTAKAQQTQAEDQLAYTELKADVPGLITARFAETGQVVQGAQPVFTIARDGPQGRGFRCRRGALNLRARRADDPGRPCVELQHRGGGPGARGGPNGQHE